MFWNRVVHARWMRVTGAKSVKNCDRGIQKWSDFGGSLCKPSTLTLFLVNFVTKCWRIVEANTVFESTRNFTLRGIHDIWVGPGLRLFMSRFDLRIDHLWGDDVKTASCWAIWFSFYWTELLEIYTVYSWIPVFAEKAKISSLAHLGKMWDPFLITGFQVFRG